MQELHAVRTSRLEEESYNQPRKRVLPIIFLEASKEAVAAPEFQFKKRDVLATQSRDGDRDLVQISSKLRIDWDVCGMRPVLLPLRSLASLIDQLTIKGRLVDGRHSRIVAHD